MRYAKQMRFFLFVPWCKAFTVMPSVGGAREIECLLALLLLPNCWMAYLQYTFMVASCPCCRGLNPSYSGVSMGRCQPHKTSLSSTECLIPLHGNVSGNERLGYDHYSFHFRGGERLQRFVINSTIISYR